MDPCRIFPSRWHAIFNSLICSLLLISLAASFAAAYFIWKTLQAPLYEEVACVSPPSRQLPCMRLSLARGDLFANHQEYTPSLPLPSSLKSMTFIGRNERPDNPLKTSELLIRPSPQKAPTVIKQNTPIFLRFDDKEALELSEEKTPISLMAELIDSDKIRLSISTEFTDLSGDAIHFGQKSYLVLKDPKDQKPPSARVASLAKKLDTFSIYPPDALIELYGGRQFSDKRKCYRMVTEGKDLKDALFVKEQQLLSLTEEGLIPHREGVSSSPLVKIERLHRKGADLSVWDEAGLSNVKVSLNVQATGQPPEAPLFKRIHRRTHQSVICKIGKQNLILRRGDWIIQGKKGWVHLKDENDVKKFLSYGLKTKLFIFDGITLENSSYVFQGHLFDETRSNAKKIRAVIGEKKVQKPKRARNSAPAGNTAL